MPTPATLYTIRRKHLLSDIRFWRARGHGPLSLHQLRMELSALRSCRVLVS